MTTIKVAPNLNNNMERDPRKSKGKHYLHVPCLMERRWNLHLLIGWEKIQKVRW
jgi:hypothetical protein